MRHACGWQDTRPWKGFSHITHVELWITISATNALKQSKDLQGEGKAPSLPTLPAVAASSLAPIPSPALAPMSVEAASGVIAAGMYSWGPTPIGCLMYRN